MVINNAVITGSFTVNGVDVAGITGSSAISSSYLALSASYLTTSASYASASGSLSTRVTNLEATSSTVSSSFATTSGSASSRLNIIETSYATTGSNVFTGAQYISNTSNPLTFSTTASLYTDGGLRVSKDSFVSGTAYFNNVVVYGTSSIQYITSSQINVGANIINLNTNLPSQRYGGMAVADSGSNAGVTGSMLWDSVNNGWIYTRESGSTYKGGALISGPRSSVQGSEQTTTACYIMAGQGGDHITSSMIYHDSSATCFYGTSYISGSGNACFSSQVCAPTVIASTCLAVRAGSATSVVNNIAGAASNNHFALQRNDVQYASLGLDGSDNFNIFGINTSCPRLTISSTGAVGLNNTSPTTDDGNLSVAGSVGTGQGITCTTAQINIWETVSGNKAGLWFGAVNCANVGVIGSRTATGNIAFQTYCAGWGERMRITYNGNVGIANISPSSFLHLGTYASSGKYIDSATLPTAPSNYLITLSPPSTTNYYGGGIAWSEGTCVAAAINAYDDGATGALGLSIATGTNSGLSERVRITSTGITTFACQVCASSFISAGNISSAGDNFICNGNPILHLQRTNNSTSPAARINFETSQGTVRWQIATNQSTGTGLEINQGDGTNRVFYIDTSGRLSLSCYLFANGGGIAMDLNASTTTISNYGYGGAVQLLRSDATSTRWSRIGIVDSGLNWVGGLQINSNLVSVFDSTVCAPTFRGNFQSSTCTFAATSAGTNYDVSYPGSGRWLASINTNSTYHWNGILALNFFDSADYSVNILTCGSYATNAAFSIVGSGAVLRMCFSQNVGNVTVNYLNF